MDTFTGLMLFGALILFVSLIVANQGLPQVCASEAKLCPDGSEVSRDPINKCEFFPCPNTDMIPYCTTNVTIVENTGNTTKTTTAQDFTIYSFENATRCIMNNTSSECRNYANLTWNRKINCSIIIDHSITFTCPTIYYEYQGYKWINCQAPINSNFTTYCDNTNYLTWIKANCGTDVVN